VEAGVARVTSHLRNEGLVLHNAWSAGQGEITTALETPSAQNDNPRGAIAGAVLAQIGIAAL
jgi:hypothetical protein